MVRARITVRCEQLVRQQPGQPAALDGGAHRRGRRQPASRRRGSGRIFESGFSTKGGDHSGLGLATVCRIVERWGGSIDDRVGARQGDDGPGRAAVAPRAEAGARGGRRRRAREFLAAEIEASGVRGDRDRTARSRRATCWSDVDVGRARRSSTGRAAPTCRCGARSRAATCAGRTSCSIERDATTHRRLPNDRARRARACLAARARTSRQLAITLHAGSARLGGMARVAFLGLGVMGGPMAGHLAKAGHEVVVYNRTRGEGVGVGRRSRSPRLADARSRPPRAPSS